MKDTILTLLTSKRALAALFTAIFDVVILLGLDIDPELANSLAVLVSSLAGAFILGQSASDTGAALGKPAGVDHKDRAG